MNVAPDVSVSSPARQCSSVDLPDPDGPMMAVNVARLERDGDAVERMDLGIADSVDLSRVDGTGGGRAARSHGGIGGGGSRRCGGNRVDMTSGLPLLRRLGIHRQVESAQPGDGQFNRRRG